MFYSYKTNFTMIATIMGSSGQGPDKLVALDNIVIKMIANASNTGNATEPQADLKEQVISEEVYFEGFFFRNYVSEWPLGGDQDQVKGAGGQDRQELERHH